MDVCFNRLERNQVKKDITTIETKFRRRKSNKRTISYGDSSSF